MKRLFCFCLIYLLVFSLVGCEKEESKTKDTSSVVSVFLDDSQLDNAFQIVRNKVLLAPQEDGSMFMEIAHNTTVEEFYTAVVAKEGYELAVLDEKGNKMNASQTIASGMTFQVIEKNNQDPFSSYVFRTVDASEIENFYKNQK